jgi:dihydrofolate reductase
MARITVVNHVTLDGVMQAPAGADEDRRGGFEHGGWAVANTDEVMIREMRKGMSGGPGSLLLGRRTYEHMAANWPHAPADNPFTKTINAQRKYVASRTLSEPLEWNAQLLVGDAADAVGALKRDLDENLVVLGSGELVQTLLGAGLIDAWVLQIHPLVLGTGRRLFPEGGAFASLRLVESVPTPTGVLIARYEPAAG